MATVKNKYVTREIINIRFIVHDGSIHYMYKIGIYHYRKKQNEGNIVMPKNLDGDNEHQKNINRGMY